MPTTFRHIEAITLQLHPDEVTYTLPEANEHGTARFLVPPTSAAFDRRYIDEDGASTVAYDEADLGLWPGVVVAADWNRDGCAVEALHISAWLDTRGVGTGRRYRGVTAGVIARAALLAAQSGLARQVIVPGTFVEGGRVIDDYVFADQSALAVLNDLHTLTGQTFRLVGFQLDWIAPPSALYPLELCEGSDLHGARRTMRTDDQVHEVVVRGADGRTETVVAEETAGSGPWRKQARISENLISPVALRARGQAELAVRRYPTVEYDVELAVAHQAVREGMTLRMHLPTAGFPSSPTTGALCRVLSRTIRNGEPFMPVKVHYLRPFSVEMRRLAADRLTATYYAPREHDLVRTLVRALPADGLVIENDQLVTIGAEKVAGRIAVQQLAEEATVRDAKARLLPVAAGTTLASAAVVVDANKRTDKLVLGTLALGAGAGTDVTSSATDLNRNAGVTPGTTAADKTVVADTNKNVSDLGMAIFRHVGTTPGNGIAFFGAATSNKLTISGSRGGNAALATLLTQLANYGLITDATTA